MCNFIQKNIETILVFSREAIMNLFYLLINENLYQDAQISSNSQIPGGGMTCYLTSRIFSYNENCLFSCEVLKYDRKIYARELRKILTIS